MLSFYYFQKPLNLSGVLRKPHTCPYCGHSTQHIHNYLNVMLYTSEKLSNAYYLKENFYEVMASTDYDTAKIA